MVNEKYKEINVKLEDLALDMNNNRLLEPVKCEKDIIEYMFANEDLLNLVNAICKDEVIYNTNIIVIKDTENTNKFIVKEGNRRITACKILSNRELIPNEYKNKVDVASESCLDNISSFTVCLYTDTEILDKALYRLHNQGVRAWNPAGKGKTYHLEFKNGKSLNDIKEKYRDSIANIKVSLLQFSLYKDVINELQENNIEYDIRNLSYLPMVSELPKKLFSVNGTDTEFTINVIKNYDNDKISYETLVGKEATYKKILLAMGKEFVCKKSSLSHQDFKTKEKYKKCLNEFSEKATDGFGELKNLIAEYNLKEKQQVEDKDINSKPKGTADNSDKGDNAENLNGQGEQSSNNQSDNVQQVAKLELKQYNINHFTHDNAVILTSYIKELKDANGNDIDFSNVTISSSDIKIINNNIYSVQDAKSVSVKYKCKIDNIVLSKILNINFIDRKTKNATASENNGFISTFKSTEYNFENLGNLGTLINEVNSMFDDKELLNKFRCIFISSLRVLYDVSTQLIWENKENITDENAKKLIVNQDIGNLTNSVENLFQKFLDNINKSNIPQNEKEFSKKILEAYGIANNTFASLFKVNDFIKYFKLVNTASHNVATYITDDDLKKISKNISIYLVLVDQILATKK